MSSHLDESVSIIIGWLNANAELDQKISLSEVAGPLSQLEPEAALAIVKDVAKKLDTIKSPNDYIKEEAMRQVAETGPRKTPATIVSVASSTSDGWDPSSWGKGPQDNKYGTEKLKRYIGWMNHNCGLVDKISYLDVIGPLSQLELATAMSILKDLEATLEKTRDNPNMKPVRNPTAYVTVAVKRALTTQVQAMSLMGSSEVDPTGKISRRITWLNKNRKLNQSLQLHRLIGPLSFLHVTAAMDILKEVEMRADKIENPTEYVLGKIGQEADMTGGMAGMFPLMSGSDMMDPWSMQQAANTFWASDWDSDQSSLAHLDPGRRISKEIRWLNTNAWLHQPVRYTEVKEVLEELDLDAALKILSDLGQNAAHVWNPTAYIVTAAKNAKPSKVSARPKPPEKPPDPKASFLRL